MHITSLRLNFAACIAASALLSACATSSPLNTSQSNTSPTQNAPTNTAEAREGVEIRAVPSSNVVSASRYYGIDPASTNDANSISLTPRSNPTSNATSSRATQATRQASSATAHTTARNTTTPTKPQSASLGITLAPVSEATLIPAVPAPTPAHTKPAAIAPEPSTRTVTSNNNSNANSGAAQIESLPELSPAPFVANTVVSDDLWDRIHAGFAMNDLESEIVAQQQQWYLDRPQSLKLMSERASKYLFHVVEELERHNFPSELALLPFVESAFNPQALSSAQAAGLWQFIPSTGRNFNMKQNRFRDDRRDVLLSTEGAIKYFQRLYAMFGDWHLALAAYNWGEGNVGRAIERNRAQGLGVRYEDLKMPKETQFYVPKLQALKNIVRMARSGSDNDIPLPSIPNHPYFQTADIDKDIDIALITKLAGVSEVEFRALNPSFKGPTIFASSNASVLLPWDNAQLFERNLKARQQGQIASWTLWIVPQTMSIAQVAQRLQMSEAQLRSANDLPSRGRIRVGSVLQVARTPNNNANVPAFLANNANIRIAQESKKAAPTNRKKSKAATTTKASAKKAPASAAKKSASANKKSTAKPVKKSTDKSKKSVGNTATKKKT